MNAASPHSDSSPHLRRLLLLALIVITLWRVAVLQGSGLTLYVDEAQYWTWAQHLAWGYYSKPPVIAGVIAATTSVCGDGTLCVKSGSLLIYPLVALLIFAIARRLFDTRIAFWSALIFFTLPGAAFSAMIISTDVPLFLCWVLAMYAYLRAIDDNGWRWWLLAGVAAGVGLLTKYTMVIFLLSVLLHLGTTTTLRAQLRNPRLYVAALVATLVFAPNVIWNAQNGWPTLHHTTDISGIEQRHGLQWGELWAFLGGQFAITGPVFLIAWLLQLGNFNRWHDDARYRLLICFALPFLGIISLQALLGRANANWGAMAYAAAIIFIVARMIEAQQWRWLWAGLILNLVLTGLIYHFDPIMQASGVELAGHGNFPKCSRAWRHFQNCGEPLAINDPMKRVRGWDRFGEQAAALRLLHPDALFLADDRDILAELEYYVRAPHPLDAVQWNPGHVIDSHYALTTTMDDKRGRDFIYVSRDAELPASTGGRFGSTQPLPALHIEIHPDYALDFHAWLLRDFRGYR
jgi:hypothetical protein